VGEFERYSIEGFGGMTMEKIIEIKKLLREREFEKAVFKIMEIIDRTVICINNMGNNTEILNEFKDILYHLEYAIKIKDVIKISDILQYVIVPFLDENNIALEE